ncbi:hypothetical protein D9M70_572400 [compost metagenome]
MCGNVVARLHAQRLEIGTVIAGTGFRGLIPMELQNVQWDRIEDLVQFAATDIDEQPHGGHEWRQGGDDRPRLVHGHRPRAFWIEHQTDGVGAGLGRDQRILYAGNATDFDANG